MTINTTGQLRDFLTTAMANVTDGTLDIDKARTVVKLAQQVNESFFAEVKVARTRYELVGQRPLGSGHLVIGEDESLAGDASSGQGPQHGDR